MMTTGSYLRPDVSYLPEMESQPVQELLEHALSAKVRAALLLISRASHTGAPLLSVPSDGRSSGQTQFIQNHVSHGGHLGAVPLRRVRERWPAQRPTAGKRRC